MLQRLLQNLSNFDQNYNRYPFLMMKNSTKQSGIVCRVVESDGKFLAKKGGGQKVLGWGQKVRF